MVLEKHPPMPRGSIRLSLLCSPMPQTHSTGLRSSPIMFTSCLPPGMPMGSSLSFLLLHDRLLLILQGQLGLP